MSDKIEKLNDQIRARRDAWGAQTARAHLRRALDLVGGTAGPGAGLAHFAYLAYTEAVDGRNRLGEPLTAWEDLPESIRLAWASTAAAVAVALAEESMP